MADKKDRISIANYLAVFGLAAIGVIIFFGSMSASSDGKPTIGIITAVIAVGLLGGCLIGAIKAKSAENDPGKWKYVEWLCLVAYVVVAFMFMSPFVRFFYIAGEKESLQKMAQDEIAYVKTLHQEYDVQREEAISQANQMLIEFNKSEKKSYDNHLQNIARDTEWAETTSGVTNIPIHQRVTDLEDRINRWDLFDVAKMANDMDGLGEKSYLRLKSKIKQYGEENSLIPVISGSANGGEFKVTGLVNFDLPKAPESTFSSTVRNADGFSVVGVSIYVILNLIVLLNIWVTRRSDYVRPTPNNRVGGTEL